MVTRSWHSNCIQIRTKLHQPLMLLRRSHVLLLVCLTRINERSMICMVLRKSLVVQEASIHMTLTQTRYSRCSLDKLETYWEVEWVKASNSLTVGSQCTHQDLVLEGQVLRDVNSSVGSSVSSQFSRTQLSTYSMVLEVCKTCKERIDETVVDKVNASIGTINRKRIAQMSSLNRDDDHR